MKFVAILRDKQRERFTLELLKAHVAHLQVLHDRGQLLSCGPFSDGAGAIKILDAASEEQAHLLLRADPFTVAGYYAGYELHAWEEASPQNGWLMNPTDC